MCVLRTDSDRTEWVSVSDYVSMYVGVIGRINCPQNPSSSSIVIDLWLGTAAFLRTMLCTSFVAE